MLKQDAKDMLVLEIIKKYGTLNNCATELGVERSTLTHNIKRGTAKFLTRLEKAGVTVQNVRDSIHKIEGSANITTHHAGIGESIVIQLIESQRQQIEFLQKMVTDMQESLDTMVKTQSGSLTYIATTCEECSKFHKTFHKQLSRKG